MRTIEIILASASPRRLELLRQIGIDPLVHAAEINETPHSSESPRQFVRRMAEEKTASISACHDNGSLVVGADTIVVVGGQIFGKPSSYDDACSILRTLSGKRHQVLTAVSVNSTKLKSTVLVESTVSFRELTPGVIDAYWRTGEPLDKAGAYAIQGFAAMFIEEIQGSYSSIMGLPLCEVAELLAEAGVKVLDLDI